jgi:hypothetical protein
MDLRKVGYAQTAETRRSLNVAPYYGVRNCGDETFQKRCGSRRFRERIGIE